MVGGDSSGEPEKKSEGHPESSADKQAVNLQATTVFSALTRPARTGYARIRSPILRTPPTTLLHSAPPAAMPESPRIRIALFSMSVIMLAAGCRMGVPIHVWQPPQLHSTVGHRVVVPTLGGKSPNRFAIDANKHLAIDGTETLEELAELTVSNTPTGAAPVEQASIASELHELIFLQVPSDPGRATELITPEKLNESTTVRLVSAVENQHSDVALASLARDQGIDFLLRGELLPDHRPLRLRKDNPQLAVSWRLMQLAAPGQRVVPAGLTQSPLTQSPSTQEQSDSTTQPRWIGGQPVVVDLKSSLKRYPDLAIATDPQTALNTALVRDSLRLITPSVDRQRVQLEIAYFMPGSKDTRRGNALAHAGKWDQAKQAWESVAQKYPFAVAAIHNLAIAAVAEQDYSKAKQLARKAVRRNPSKLHKQTLVWVEQKQRAYHEAFGLPDPPEGWFVTHKDAELRE